MLRIPFTAILICIGISLGFAQDSTKKIGPAPLQTPVKVHKFKPHTVKADSGKKVVVAPPVTIVPVAKPDTSKKAPIVIKSLNSQYVDFFNFVHHYQQPTLSVFWKSVSDTLKQYRAQIKATKAKLPLQAKLIDSLKQEIQSKDQALSEKVTEVNIIGITLSLSTYNLIVWALIIVFVLATFIVISRSGSFKHEAQYRIKLYSELEDEFKAYKTKANEKEKKLARELQTERNKLDELLGRG